MLGSSGEIRAEPTKFYNYYWITMLKFDYSLEIIKDKFDKNHGTNYKSGAGKGWAHAQRQLFYRVLTEDKIEVYHCFLIFCSHMVCLKESVLVSINNVNFTTTSSGFDMNFTFIEAKTKGFGSI